MMDATCAPPKSRKSDHGGHKTIGHKYDVALDPEQYGALLDVWESATNPLQDPAALPTPRLLDDPAISGYFDRACEFIERIDLDQKPKDVDAILALFGKISALVLDEEMTVRAANSAARKRLLIHKRSKLSELSIPPGDIKFISRTARSLLASTTRDTAILRVRALEDEHFVMLRLQRCHAAGGVPLVMAASRVVSWPKGFCDILHCAFGLSGAEAEIVRGLVECCSIGDIAAQRERSVDTVRAQVKSILHKTNTRSQVELVRLALSVMDVTNLALEMPTRPRLISPECAPLKPHKFQSLITPDGRRLDYLILGDPKGTPVLYLPHYFGMVRWPASAEAQAATRGWRIIVPVRAGYGRSDPLPKHMDYDDAVITDTMHILKAEKVKTCPILTLGSDSFFGMQLARLYPDSFTALVACAGVLPMTRPEQFDRMGKWHRMAMTSAKYTPHLLSFIVRTGFFLSRKIGKRGFVHALYGGSAADIHTFENPETFAAIITGSEITLSENGSAHDSFSSLLLGRQSGDWSADVDALKGRLPVIFINGRQDPYVPFETLQGFEHDHDWIDYRIYDDAGQLIFFDHWLDVLNVLDTFME